VYRRRRIVVGVLALAVLVAIVIGVTSLVGGGGAGADDAPNAAGATPTATRTATASPTPVPTVTVGFEPTDCVPGALEVIGTAAAEAYAAGSSIAFSLTVTNVGPVPCLVDGGTTNLGVIVTSGEDRVWASTDCPAGEAERPLLLDTGAVERVTVRWDQVRSAPGCPAGQPSALPGTYRAVATLDGGRTAAPGWETIFLIQ